jgi:hypothetical protein
MSRKVFTAGEVLTAADVNSFLMDQSVMSFATSASRGSAIASPVEGMVTYLEDNNSYQSYDGSAWVGLVPQSPNAIINGAFEINQRGFTSTTSSGTRGQDRYIVQSVDGTVTYSAQSFSAGELEVAGFGSPTNYARLQTTGQTLSSALAFISQAIEDVRTLSGQTVTFSFWAKASSGTPKVAPELVQLFGSGGSSFVSTPAGQVTLSTSWARYSLTATLPNVVGKTIGAGNNLGVNFWTSAGSNFNSRTGSLGIQSATIDTWGWQLEAGPVATPFRRNANSLQGELAACQRYYLQLGGGATSTGVFANGHYYNNTSPYCTTFFPVQMRVAPSQAAINIANFSVFSNGASIACNNFFASSTSPTSANAVFATTSVATTGVGCWVEQTNANAAIAYNAEL